MYNYALMQTIERQFVCKICSRERENFMYEVFLENGLDVYMKKTSVEREHRPLIKHFDFGGAV